MESVTEQTGTLGFRHPKLILSTLAIGGAAAGLSFVLPASAGGVLLVGADQLYAICLQTAKRELAITDPKAMRSRIGSLKELLVIACIVVAAYLIDSGTHHIPKGETSRELVLAATPGLRVTSWFAAGLAIYYSVLIVSSAHKQVRMRGQVSPKV